MRLFDPHIHMTSRTTDDYEAMAQAGTRALVEPAFWLGQPRTKVGRFVDYFDALLGWEPFRAGQFGIRHHCALALNPKEANDPGLATDVLAVLPRYLAKDRVVAVGELGHDAQTAAEDEAFAAQVQLAIEADLLVLADTPHRDKLAGALKAIPGAPSAVTRHLEVETYTWSVLPPDRRPADDAGLVADLAGEMEWARGQLAVLGLHEVDR